MRRSAWPRIAGAALLWPAGVSLALPILERFPDGSYRSALRWNAQCKSRDLTPIPVRVIEYLLPGVPRTEASYRVVTNILEPKRAPAEELATLYRERWEMETAFDAFKTHLRDPQRVLRSRTPELVRQEAWGFLLAHFAIRALMHEAAFGAQPRARDPDTLSFMHTLRVTRRTLPHLAAIPPQDHARLALAIVPRRSARLVIFELVESNRTMRVSGSWIWAIRPPALMLTVVVRVPVAPGATTVASLPPAVVGK